MSHFDHAAIAAMNPTKPATESDDHRNSLGVRPRSSQPLPAILLAEVVVVEGLVRSVSIDGMVLYVPGTLQDEADVGDAITLLIYLPGTTTHSRFPANITQKEVIRCGAFYRVHFEPGASAEAVRKQSRLLNYLSRHRDESERFASARSCVPAEMMLKTRSS